MTEIATDTVVSTAEDLLYFGHDLDANAVNHARLEDNFIKEVKEKYPLVRLKNRYDNGFKQRLDLPDVSQEDYYAWLIARGWAKCSLSFALVPQQRKSELMERAKEEYPDAFSED